MKKNSLPVDLLRSETSLLKPVPIRKLRQRRFEQRTPVGSAVFFILKLLDANEFVFLSVFTIIETIFPQLRAKPLSKNEKKTTSGWHASLKNFFA